MKRACLKSDGFTLIELLVVIAIISILASLTIATISFASNKAARDRAKSEINALSVAIESYKIDNGDYPRDTTSTDGLNAQTSTNASQYSAASLVLYKALSGDTNANRVITAAERAANNNKVYFQFKPNMLYPKAPTGSTNPVTALADPFGNAYGYSTKNKADVENGVSPPGGYNPTFDLWSTVDVNKTGSTPTATWITNW